jgi:hypothetical protein
MRKTASWLRIRRSTEYKVVAAMIATTWQARLRLSVTKQLRRQAHSCMAHYRSARAFAVNPARLTGAPLRAAGD